VGRGDRSGSEDGQSVQQRLAGRGTRMPLSGGPTAMSGPLCG
jgi:hypothetical protein